MLNERKIKILQAIISDYIESAEPIGSRTIAKKYDMGVSSATIRNEMSDLEELGYIIAPHTSSGRIPSDKGYRLYVDSLMKEKGLSPSELQYLKMVMLQNLAQAEHLMQEIAHAVAYITNYTAVAASPKAKKNAIATIQIVPIDTASIVLMLITDLKVVKNQILPLDPAPNQEEAQGLSLVLNSRLQGKTLDGIKNISIEKIAVSMPQKFAFAASLFLQNIIAALHYADQTQLYMSGIKNILGFPEFSNLEKARAVMDALEEKEEILSLLSSAKADPQRAHIEVIIGGENSHTNLKDCSIIKAKIRIDDMWRSIAIIGPTRMDYAQAIGVLSTILNNLKE